MAKERKLIDQKRAEWALECVKEVKEKKEEYKALARKMTAMIMTNGLGQTLAFLRSKDKKMLYNHLSSWLMGKEAPVVWESGDNDLLERLINSDTITYRQATKEALAFIGWLKRFSEAYLGKEER